MSTLLDCLSYPEFDTYVAPDGTRYNLQKVGGVHDSRWVMDEEGAGMPPIEYVTQRAPYQHGVTPVNYFLQPRVYQLVIRQNFASRSAWQRGRFSLLSAIRPNAQPGANKDFKNTGTLLRSLSNGLVLALDCMVQQGPGFAPRAGKGWDEWSFTETIRFIAFSPVYYDQRLCTVVWSGSTLSGLSSPVVRYEGSWYETPIITLIGPMATPIQIVNAATGAIFGLDYTLVDGETVVIDLRDGHKTVTSSLVGDLVAKVADLAGLTEWRLQPGNQTIVVYAANGAANVHMAYHNRYLGR